MAASMILQDTRRRPEYVDFEQQLGAPVQGFELPSTKEKSRTFGVGGLKNLASMLGGVSGLELANLEKMFGIRQDAIGNALKELDPAGDQARIAAYEREVLGSAEDQAIRTKRQLKDQGFNEDIVAATDMEATRDAYGKTGDFAAQLMSPDSRLSRFMQQVGLTDPQMQLAFTQYLEKILGGLAGQQPGPKSPTIWEGLLGVASNVVPKIDF